MKKRTSFTTEQRGAAMIVVLCVLAILLALSLSLLLAASTIMGTEKKTGNTEKCRELAISLSDRLTEELTENDAIHLYEGTDQDLNMTNAGISVYVTNALRQSFENDPPIDRILVEEWTAGEDFNDVRARAESNLGDDDVYSFSWSGANEALGILDGFKLTMQPYLIYKGDRDVLAGKVTAASGKAKYDAYTGEDIYLGMLVRCENTKQTAGFDVRTYCKVSVSTKTSTKQVIWNWEKEWRE